MQATIVRHRSSAAPSPSLPTFFCIQDKHSSFFHLRNCLNFYQAAVMQRAYRHYRPGRPVFAKELGVHLVENIPVPYIGQIHATLYYSAPPYACRLKYTLQILQCMP